MNLQEQGKTIKSVVDIADMKKTIYRIQGLLNEILFDEIEARQLIDEVNNKHPENLGVFNLLTFSNGSNTAVGRSRVTVNNASPSQLAEDLKWKQFYLDAKMKGKTIDVLSKEWNSLKNKDKL